MANAKRNVRIAGRPTSISAEPQFWNALQAIARSKNMTIDALGDQHCEGPPAQPLLRGAPVSCLTITANHVAELIG